MPTDLILVLDLPDRTQTERLLDRVGSSVAWVKVGLQLFTRYGPSIVEEIANRGYRVFLDLKLHDIPATVERAAANCAACGASMFTVHAAGGRAMLEAAAAGAHSGIVEDPPRIVAVTVLTSLDGAALAELDIPRTAADLVGAWAKLAQRCGLDGVVASAHEAAALRRDRGKGFLIVTPGIRPESSSTDDQRRVVTPADAIEAGADVLVVGRPITGAPNPLAAARGILEEMASGQADQL